jgi:site-specific DNA-methyltransferase (adenine-specific)
MTKLKVDKVYRADCLDVAKKLIKDKIKPDLIYCDIIYKIPPSATTLMTLIACLKPGGAFWLQTDQNSVASMKQLLDSLKDCTRKDLRLKYINWIIWSYNWGGRPKDAFSRKHDDLLYFIKVGDKHIFNARAIAVPKMALINSTKSYQIPTDVWQGNFYTTSKERIKDFETDKGYLWQKPEFLLARIIKACTNKKDLVFEPFLGTGTACVVAKKLGRSYIGCDTSNKMYLVATDRLKNTKYGETITGSFRDEKIN